MSSKSSEAFRAMIAILALFSTSAHASNDITGIPSVIDGDTLEIHGQRIRLHGIDAPENRQTCTVDGKSYRCGQKAASALDELISGASIKCIHKGKDQYRRVLAVCYRGDTDINAWLVEHGWALAYRRYSKKYVPNENAAKTNRAGIWEGEFVTPWDYRHQSKRGPTS